MEKQFLTCHFLFPLEMTPALQFTDLWVELASALLNNVLSMWLCFFPDHGFECSDLIFKFMQLVATAALFLATKSEETPCLLNTVLRASCEVCQKHNFAFFPFLVYSVSILNQMFYQVISSLRIVVIT